MGEGLSPYPFSLCLPQDEHERLLVKALATEGVTIEWGTKLERLELREDGVSAVLHGPGGMQERAEVAYVAGCYGAHSRVREAMPIGCSTGWRHISVSGAASCWAMRGICAVPLVARG